jgi:hypothetical protein
MIFWHLCGNFGFYKWCKSIVVILSLLENYLGKFVHWVNFAWGHQTIHTFGDKGYHLLPWLMMFHKQIGASYYVLEAQFNKYMNCARVVVRNSFGILIFGNGLSCQTWMCISFLMWSWPKVGKRVKIVWRFIWTQQNCEHMKLWKA